MLNNSKKEIIQPNHSNILFSKKISKIKNKKNFRENKLIQNYSSSFVKNKNKKVKSNLKSYNKIFENKKNISNNNSASPHNIKIIKHKTPKIKQRINILNKKSK